MNDKIKILYIVPSLRLCNGVASYAMNYFRTIDKKEIQIDFITTVNERSVHYDEIEKSGSQIFYIQQLKFGSIIKTLKTIRQFFETNQYDIVHCHLLNMGAIFLHYAKKYKIPIRILHSHATKYSDNKINAMINFALSKVAIKCANVNFACSKLAGDFLFKKREYSIIKNAINTKKFVFNEYSRKKIREQENIKDDELLLGNIGRLEPQKNIFFLLDIFKNICRESQKYKLILIGHGTQEKKVLEKIKEYKLEDRIIMKKNITNVNEYMQAIDIFVLPSLYEGLPVVGIEAQASDLTCFFADTISQEAKITPNVKFLPINDKKAWIEEISNFEKRDRKDVSKIIAEHGYDIKTESKNLIDKYKNLYREYNKNSSLK